MSENQHEILNLPVLQAEAHINLKIENILSLFLSESVVDVFCRARKCLLFRMSSRVFIGRLSPHATERNVEKFFKGYGRIKEIDLKNGFGFVEFEDYRDAEDAVYELDGKELCNERVTVEHARARPRGGRGGGRFQGRFSQRWSRSSGGGRNGPPVRTENRVIVENLSSRVSWQPLVMSLAL
ncbi:serine/arginine-rich splicing factor 5-like isoform X3 [Rhinoraja longicauda]